MPSAKMCSISTIIVMNAPAARSEVICLCIFTFQQSSFLFHVYYDWDFYLPVVFFQSVGMRMIRKSNSAPHSKFMWKCSIWSWTKMVINDKARRKTAIVVWYVEQRVKGICGAFVAMEEAAIQSHFKGGHIYCVGVAAWCPQTQIVLWLMLPGRRELAQLVDTAETL